MDSQVIGEGWIISLLIEAGMRDAAEIDYQPEVHPAEWWA